MSKGEFYKAEHWKRLMDIYQKRVAEIDALPLEERNALPRHRDRAYYQERLTKFQRWYAESLERAK